MDTIVLLSLVVWMVVIPMLVLGLSLRGARVREALAPGHQDGPRACERRRRNSHAPPLRASRPI